MYYLNCAQFFWIGLYEITNDSLSNGVMVNIKHAVIQKYVELNRTLKEEGTKDLQWVDNI